MSQATSIMKHETEQLPAELAELGQALATLPAEHRSQIELVFGRVVESTKRRRRILTLVQDALSQLRLDMKYLMFDLEATRRERDEFKKKLDEAEGGGFQGE